MAEEKRAKVQDMLLEGAIMKSYGSKYFVSITLAPEICKAKVEMVEIGSNGKNSNTVYLDIEILRQLFTELDTNVYLVFDEELKPQQRRVMGFPGRLF